MSFERTKKKNKGNHLEETKKIKPKALERGGEDVLTTAKRN
jgi:hypothetical protein